MKYKIFLTIALFCIGCGSKDDRDGGFNNGEDAESGNPPRQSFVVRTNQKTGKAEYAIASFDSKAHPQALATMAEGITQWKPIEDDQVISSKSGYPSQGRRQLYFVQDPSSFSKNIYPQIPQQGQMQGQGPMQNSGITFSRNGMNQPSQLPSYGGGGGAYPSQPIYNPGAGGAYPSQPIYNPGYGNGGTQLPSGPGYPGWEGANPGYGGGGAYPSQPIYNPGYGGGYPPGGGVPPGTGYPPGQVAPPYCNTMAFANCYGYLPATYTTGWVYWNPSYYYSAAPYNYAFYAYGW